MNKANKQLLYAIGIMLVLVIGFIYFKDIKPLAILPELDNRLVYWDNAIDATQLASGSWTTPITGCPDTSGVYCFQSDKFYVYRNGAQITFGSTSGTPYQMIQLSACGGYSGSIISVKDFAELKIYISQMIRTGRGIFLSDGSDEIEIPVTGSSAFIRNNLEILPDNLNPNTYSWYFNGEYAGRHTFTKNHLYIIFRISGGSCNTGEKGADLYVDYIKYIPNEAYIIRNDEVWVKEVRGSSYSFSDLNWEMIGFQSEIRPATIRDLTAQTEKPAPLIYSNLINNQPVAVQPNTVHTFYYRTKWTQGLDSSCQGDLDKVEVKQNDGTWKCESFVKETPIIQQCQTKSDCAILPECESQKELISCNQNTHLCDYSLFSPACKNQLITYQEKITEIENTKFVPIPSGTNSFFCFFDNTKSSCNAGEKTISVSAPGYTCSAPPDTLISTGKQPDECWQTTLNFDGKNYVFKNNEKKGIGFNINAETSMGASLDSKGKLKDNWGIVGKFTLPDDFLELKSKDLGNSKFILQNSDDKITFIITNNLGFGIDGGYTIHTQNTALEGGVVLRDETIPIFLSNGNNEITYNFKTSQLGTIVDIIGAFGSVNTDRNYIMKSGSDGKQKFLIITKEVKTEIPAEIEKVQPKVEVVERIVSVPIVQEKEVFVEKIVDKTPFWVYPSIIVAVLVIVGLIYWFKH